MFWEFPLKIQTHNSYTEEITYTEFQNKEQLIEFIQKNFRIPGQYNLKNTKYWQKEGLKYAKTVCKPNFEGGYYTPAVKRSQQWKKYWANEKEKVKNGVIIDGHYLPSFYYWYINFCPIYDDLAKKTRFGDVWDTDIWYMQYAMLCILRGKHIGGVKGRQKGFSFKHMAILYWSYCWFEGSVNTIGSYLEDLVTKSWRFLERYRKHINTYTAWKRGPQRAKSLEWYERTELKTGGYAGLDSKIVGVSFKQSASNDVGGSQTFFNYEEPGLSPTLLETIEYIRPAVEKGSETLGFIIACGSVGDLDDAKAIKEIFYNPSDYNFLGIPNIWDEDGHGTECCIFASEAYSMIGRDVDKDKDGNVIGGTGKPFIDENGNSDVELSLEWIGRAKERLKKNKKKGDLKQIALSQKCTTPKEAFAQRKTARFPIERIARQQEYLRGLHPDSRELPRRMEIEVDEKTGKIVLKNSDKEDLPYPVKPEWEDKEGVILIHKMPEENPAMYTYFAGVDNVEVDETTTSESVFSVYIVEGTTEVYYTDDEGKQKMRIEGDQIVASCTGRLSTVDATNRRAELLIRLYNAFTLCEKNKPNFINHMKKKGLSHLLAAENDVPIFKDLTIDYLRNDAKGIHMDSTGKKQKIADDYGIEWLNTESGAEYKIDKDGNQTDESFITRYKIHTIKDYWLLEELRNEKDNTDRRDAWRLANLLKAIWQANGIKRKRIEKAKNAKPKPKTFKGVSFLYTPKRKSNQNKKNRGISFLG
jgi:hypothetical protein